MAGKIAQLIDTIVDRRAHGNETIATATRMKLTFKGINPDHYNNESDDDEKMLRYLRDVAKEMGVFL